ncbi:MAG TPA: WecB/TagA/CpsF family glycosyltransferase [Candidatus Limnocylindria bacterium]
MGTGSVIGGPARQRIELAGVLIDRVDQGAASATLDAFLADGRSHQIVTVNTDFVRLAQEDPGFRAVLNRADLAVADGMPIVWLSRLQGDPLPTRVAGIELVEESCRLAAREGVGVFLLGAGPGVAEAASRELAIRHPGLRIAGVLSPSFGDWSGEEEDRIVDVIRAAGRCVLFVAFGAPRQDRFIAAHLAEITTPIAIGVGCTFDIIIGAKRRAPAWMRRSGLEWLWRLAQEPRRLAGRYLLQDLPLVLRLGAAAVRDGRRVPEAT